MGTRYEMVVAPQEGLAKPLRPIDISLISVAGFPNGEPKNDKAAIAKAQAWISWHNTHRNPNETFLNLLQVRKRKVDYDVLWSKFTA